MTKKSKDKKAKKSKKQPVFPAATLVDIQPLDIEHENLKKLAEFIMREIPHEVTEPEGAVDCAIRLLRNAYVHGLVTTATPPPEVPA